MLLRKLLMLPSKPAVLMYNLWVPGFNRYSYWEVRRPSCVPTLCIFDSPCWLAALREYGPVDMLEGKFQSPGC